MMSQLEMDNGAGKTEYSVVVMTAFFEIRIILTKAIVLNDGS